MVWYSHLFKNFPEFVVIYTAKGFLELSCFFNDPMVVGNLISGSSTFSKSSLNIWEFKVYILLKPSLENFEHYFARVYGSVQFSSVAQSCQTLCDPMYRSTPGLPVHYQLPEFSQTHVHQVSDAIQPSHPLLSPSSAPNPYYHQSLFQ